MSCETCDKYAEEMNEYEYECDKVKSGRKICPMVFLSPKNTIVVELYYLLKSDLIHTTRLHEQLLDKYVGEIEAIGGMNELINGFVILEQEFHSFQKGRGEGTPRKESKKPAVASRHRS